MRTTLGIEMQKALHLADAEAKKAPKHLGLEYAVFEKYDGWYMYVDCIDGVWQGIRSSTHRPLPSMAYYDALLAAGPKPNQNLRLIFEATIPDMVFKDLNGRFNQTKVALKDVVFKCHDVLFEKYPFSIFTKRYERMEQVVNYLRKSPELRCFEIAPILATSADKDVWLEHYNRIIDQPNGEGIILKQTNAMYEQGKRAHSLMKVKCEVTLDLLVRGIGRGEVGSKYEHTTGFLIVENKAGQRFTVSGMTDGQRDHWFAHPDDIVGKVVEIKAMKVLANGSLREGRFKAIRFNKTVNDID
ncbi:DNA ligase [Shewanella phage SppYZU05]|uniref:DNA ligase n=1 Tax=Shewanella phage SppYZU05 TaxID=1970795 RepID=A0A1W6JTF3_9CAUD|nr:DNA ligase [Shewanella phage SppYZU05]ARM70554.1 DNA ligase [Shewanella phage SppYZU05]